MYIVYEIEKHYDRIHGDFFGPFPDYESAKAFAKESEVSDSNKITDHQGNFHGHYRYDYVVTSLEEIPKKD